MREYEIPWYLGTLDHIGKIEFYIGTFERVPSLLGTYFYKLLHCNILLLSAYQFIVQQFTKNIISVPS